MSGSPELFILATVCVLSAPEIFDPDLTVNPTIDYYGTCSEIPFICSLPPF